MTGTFNAARFSIFTLIDNPLRCQSVLPNIVIGVNDEVNGLYQFLTITDFVIPYLRDSKNRLC